jgi:uncharacterized protein YodC (DUF2158 family)
MSASALAPQEIPEGNTSRTQHFMAVVKRYDALIAGESLRAEDTMAKRFKVGDIVQLKSGGPDMTVKEYGLDPDDVWCQWFGGRKLEVGQFPEGSLIPVTPAEKK